MTIKVTKTYKLIEQVIDDLLLTEGENTEITVAAVRGAWDDVHPKLAVPSPATVKNNLDKMVGDGKLVKLNSKSYTFAEEPKPEAPAPAAPKKEEWIEVSPAHSGGPRATHIASMRLSPIAKTPCVVVRVNRQLLDERNCDRVAVRISKDGRKFALVCDENGYKVNGASKHGAFYVVRIVGTNAREIFEYADRWTNASFLYDEVREEGGVLIFDKPREEEW